MKLSRFAVFFIMMFFSIPFGLDSTRAGDEIYMYVDENGVRHFTNIPMASVGEDFKFKIYTKGQAAGSRRGINTDSFDHCISEAARRYGLSKSLLKAVIKVESNFNPGAVSKKGAVGLMQIMPFNFKLLSIKDPFDPWENVMGGARYLKRMLNRFKGDLSLSLAAYNAGPNLVDRYGCIPPYPETRNYVKKVLEYVDYYGKNG